MCENKNLKTLIQLYRHNNVRVQSLTQEVIENLKESAGTLCCTFLSKDLHIDIRQFTVSGDLFMDVTNGFRPLVDLSKYNDDDVAVLAVWSLAYLAAHSGLLLDS